MSTISTTDARGLITKMLVDVYKERTAPTAFLRSFFPAKESATKSLSIEVQRGTEKVAVDVERGTEGNRNTFSRTSEKIFIPPYYREYLDATDLDLYDMLFSMPNVDSAIFSQFMDQLADKLRLLQDIIERAYEVQASEVLETGIVTLEEGINIDFKRKAASLVDKGAGNYWATGTVDPYDDLETGANFIRKVGKASGDIFNVLMGSEALADFLNNTKVKERADIRNFMLDEVLMPQRTSSGASPHGVVSAGSYRFRIWTYAQFFDTKAGVSTAYLNPKKIVILPEAPRFVMGFAAVPQLLTMGQGVRKGAFIFGDYIDERNSKHVFDIKSAGVAIPVAVDTVHTTQVVTS